MIRLGIAGLGRWGRILVESVQHRSDSVRFVAAATGTPARAADYAARWGLALEPNVQTLIEREDIEGVVLATPHSQHLVQMLAAFGAGKHVFVEKPITLRHEDALRAAEAAEAAGRVLAAGFNRRFLPSAQRLKSAVDDGELGQILMIESNFSAPGGYRYAPGMWRVDPNESPAGGMTGLGIHLVDFLIHLGGPIAGVSTRARRRVPGLLLDDTVSVSIDFASGALASLTTLVATASLWSVRVMGSEGWAEMRGHEHLTIARRSAVATEELSYPFFDAERAELEAFGRAIAGDAPYPVPVEEALHGTAVFEAIVRSAEDGRAAAVP